MKITAWFLGLLFASASFAQSSTVNSFNLALGNAPLGSYPTQAAAQAAATAHGPGSYTVTPFTVTTTAGTATVYVVSAVSPSGSTLIPPTTSVLTDTAGNKWGLINGQVTVNGTADPSTTKVGELAYVTGTLWQESTNLGGVSLWWGKTSPTASWLPSAGTAVSPLGPQCGASPGTSTKLIQCPVNTTGTWTQTTTYTQVAPPACWTPVLSPLTAPAGACTANSGAVSRPASNTGSGFFTFNGKLYDANSNEFRIRGVNWLHYDNGSGKYIGKSGANAVRFFVDDKATGCAPYCVATQVNLLVGLKQVPIPVIAFTPTGAPTSGSAETGVLDSVTAYWVSQAAALKPFEKYVLINLANEWGNSGDANDWAITYPKEVSAMRSAGILATLVIDANDWGQGTATLVNNACNVLSQDPQHNLVFSLHIYGNAQNQASMTTINNSLNAASVSCGAVFAELEFGPSTPPLKNGPSPSPFGGTAIVAAAEAANIPWAAWAWDDNNLSGGQTSATGAFGMTLNGPGTYNTAADLTLWGSQMVAQWSALAKPASIFTN